MTPALSGRRRSGAAVPGGRADRGSAAVELVLLGPLVAVVLLLVAGLGRVGEGRQDVVAAARDAARAASLEHSISASTAAGVSAAHGAIGKQGLSCNRLSVRVDVSAYRPGGRVTATVACTVSLADLRLAGFRPMHTLTATAVAPVEIWRGL